MTVTASIEEIVCESDIAALETYIEHGMLHDSPFTQAEIPTLWESCWIAWGARDPIDHLELGALMAEIKAAYPWLPGKPGWAVVGDPEEA